MSQYVELARKLKALADRGVGGEQANAARMLRLLMDKHGLYMEDIEEPDRTNHYIECQHKQERILRGCIWKIMGKDVNLYKSAMKKHGYVIKCTNAEFLEIEANFHFYWRAFEQEYDIFLSAFVQKNKLLPFDADTVDIGDVSEEEYQKYRKILNMADQLDRKVFRKALHL